MQIKILSALADRQGQSKIIPDSILNKICGMPAASNIVFYLISFIEKEYLKYLQYLQLDK